MKTILRPIKTISLGDQEPLDLSQLLTNNINTNDRGIIIQIFAHGGSQGIRHHNDVRYPLIPWNLVLETVSLCRTHHRIRLDMIGICNSFYALQSLTPQMRIDQLWHTIDFTEWQSVYGNSRMCDTFDQFSNDLRQDPRIEERYFGKFREVSSQILPLG